MRNEQPNDRRERGEAPRGNYTGLPELDNAIDGAVRVGGRFGASVLETLSETLDGISEGIEASRAMRGGQEISLSTWKRRMSLRLKRQKQDSYLALCIVGWVFTACFAITALVMGILWGVGPAQLGVSAEDAVVFPILTLIMSLSAVGFGFMGYFGTKGYRYVARLRRCLTAARDWVCNLDALAKAAGLPRATVRQDVAKAIRCGDLPDAALSDAGDCLYLDVERAAPPDEAAMEPPADPAPPQTEAGRFAGEGADFLAMLRRCEGRLGADTDAELREMERLCGAILTFAESHPEQLPRLRRLREYYLPTTRKLLDTALGLDDTPGAQAAEIRRDITGILHTLNQAYARLYDTLLQDIGLDVSTEIDALEAMLRQDGLTQDFAADFRPGTQ